MKFGASGIVVSNHGGRQLDGVLSSAKALPAIADAVGGDLTVLADGGIRSGLDVVRMLALGAKGVMLGRAFAYAMAAGGQGAVENLLDIIAREMKNVFGQVSKFLIIVFKTTLIRIIERLGFRISARYRAGSMGRALREGTAR